VAILAVVVLASMTTGCLKATISLDVVLNPTEYTVGDCLEGTMTVIATGIGKAGVYTTLTVEFLDDLGEAQEGATLTVKDLQIWVTPVGNEQQPFELVGYELAVPAEALGAAKVRFTLTGGGLAVIPIFDTVDITVASPVS